MIPLAALRSLLTWGNAQATRLQLSIDVTDYYRPILVVIRELNGSCRDLPSAPLGASGDVRSYRTASGWWSRTTVRDYDGTTGE